MPVSLSTRLADCKVRLRYRAEVIQGGMLITLTALAVNLGRAYLEQNTVQYTSTQGSLSTVSRNIDPAR